ncbi:MAG: alpha/beta hydrolase [Acidimicrobiales bacterium]
MPPEIEQRTGTFTGAGGLSLFFRRWLPAGPSVGRVVLAHGLGEHSGRYDHVGRSLAAAGYRVWALDHRGHGRSEGERVLVDRFETFEADLETFRILAADTDGGEGAGELPAVLLGHSMGGAIALGHVIGHPGSFAALVLSGPALEPGRGVSAVTALAGRLVARLAPGTGVLQLDATAVSRDQAVVAAYREDPLVHHGKVTAGLGAAMLARAARFPAEVAGVRLPVLIVHGGADRLVPVEGSRAMVPRFGSDDVTLVVEDGMFHEVLNEPEWERVLGSIRSWIDAHCGATGQGAGVGR